jgi:hypothetical protein
MTRKEKGTEFELWLLSKIQEFDSFARLSRASGASHDKADIVSSYLFTEAKNWNKKNIIMQWKDWLHLMNKQPIDTQKHSIYGFQNSEDKKFIIVEANEFFRIYKEYIFLKEGRNK